MFLRLRWFGETMFIEILRCYYDNVSLFGGQDCRERAKIETGRGCRFSCDRYERSETSGSVFGDFGNRE